MLIGCHFAKLVEQLAGFEQLSCCVPIIFEKFFDFPNSKFRLESGGVVTNFGF